MTDRRLVLRALLDAHHPPDDTEASYVESMVALTHLPGDPFSRRHFTPGHFTASAFVISPDGASLLLIHHEKLHRWLQPGGHVEDGDADVFGAAAREVREETGLEAFEPLEEGALFDVDVHDIPALKGEPSHRHYDVRVAFLARSTELRAGAGVTGAKWVRLTEMADAGTDESVLRAVRKLLGA